MAVNQAVHGGRKEGRKGEEGGRKAQRRGVEKGVEVLVREKEGMEEGEGKE